MPSPHRPVVVAIVVMAAAFVSGATAEHLYIQGELADAHTARDESRKQAEMAHNERLAMVALLDRLTKDLEDDGFFKRHPEEGDLAAR